MNGTKSAKPSEVMLMLRSEDPNRRKREFAEFFAFRPDRLTDEDAAENVNGGKRGGGRGDN